MNDWISVNVVASPKEFAEVIVADEDGAVWVAQWSGGEWVEVSSGVALGWITHWMPLPEPPK